MERVFEPTKVRPQILRTQDDIEPVVRGILIRYEADTRLIEAAAGQWQIRVLLIGQPVPFHELPQSEQTYPFPLPSVDHGLVALSYDRFRTGAMSGQFGPSFIWCGDAFVSARSIMYADSIHYSPEGNRVLARVIVERAKARGLLKL